MMKYRATLLLDAPDADKRIPNKIVGMLPHFFRGRSTDVFHPLTLEKPLGPLRSA